MEDPPTMTTAFELLSKDPPMMHPHPQWMEESNPPFMTVFLTGPPPQPLMPMASNHHMPFRSLKKKNLQDRVVNPPERAPSKLLCHSNMAQRPFYYPYRDKIVVTGQQIITDSNCITSTSEGLPIPHSSIYDSTTVNYSTTSPTTYSAATQYIDTSCILQSSPVAQVPSISGTSLFDYQTSSSCFEPIYYSDDVSHCGGNYNNDNDTREKSLDDWIQYLHSDDEGGPSFDDQEFINTGLNNSDTLFPELGEEDFTMLDDILAQETLFVEEFDHCSAMQDMPAGTSATTYQQQADDVNVHGSPQYQIYPPEEEQVQQIQELQQIHYIPIAPKPVNYHQLPSRPSPTSSTTSSSTNNITAASNPRKRQRIEFTSHEEEYRIKRDLNNVASAKSREKKRLQQEFMKTEKVRLESRNRQLKNEVEEYERQIATLKDILYSKIKK